MKKLLTSLALAGAILTTSVAVASADFADVPKTHTYYTEIEEMKELRVINGYENNTYRPNNVILRKHVASLIYKSMDLPVVRPAAVFADVEATSSYYPMIQALYQAGIVDGEVRNGQRYYNPEASLSRAQMAKMLTLAYKLDNKGQANFSDVKTTDWAYPYINRLYSNQITTGNNGKFMPNAKVTRQHFAVFMYRTLAEKRMLSLDGQADYALAQWIKQGQAYAPGNYIAGQIPVGEYVFMPMTDDLYFYSEEIVGGEIIDNEIFDTFGYVHVHGVGNIETDGVLIPLAQVQEAGYSGAAALYGALQNMRTYKGQGMYKIGTDVAAGTITVLSTEQDAYVSLETGPVGKGDIVDNHIFTGRYQVNAQNGQYIVISGGQM